MRWCFLAILGIGCGIESSGQKVTVFLRDREVTCIEPDVVNDTDVPGPAEGYLELDQAEDFYQAELVELSSGEAISVGARRDGTTVTYTCPSGIESFIVRHATIIQAKRGAGGGASAPAP